MAKNSTPNNSLTKTDLDTALKKYPTKSDLNKTERVLRVEILKVEARVENVEDGLKRVEKKLGDKIDGIDVKLDRIATQLDGFVGRVDDLTNDNEIGADQVHELRETAKNHEKRIAKLESQN